MGENKQYESDPSDAYFERNQMAFVLASVCDTLGYIVGLKNRRSEWPILYIDLPEGQVSWHIPRNEIRGKWPDYLSEWDGHTVGQKRERLAKFMRNFPQHLMEVFSS